jgi:hypothetical protein
MILQDITLPVAKEFGITLLDGYNHDCGWTVGARGGGDKPHVRWHGDKRIMITLDD